MEQVEEGQGGRAAGRQGGRAIGGLGWAGGPWRLVAGGMAVAGGWWLAAWRAGLGWLGLAAWRHGGKAWR